MIEINDHTMNAGNITVNYFHGDEEKDLTFDYELLIEHVSEEGLNSGWGWGRQVEEDGTREIVDTMADPTIWTDENTDEALKSYLEKLHQIK